jgi:hypothetical protein
MLESMEARDKEGLQLPVYIAAPQSRGMYECHILYIQYVYTHARHVVYFHIVTYDM